MASVDVTVRGAGIFGLSVAWACLSRGARVRVIDPGGPGAGASGGVVGALAPHVPENWNPKKAFQLESLLAQEDFWARVAEVSGRDPGYRRAGRLQPLADEAAVTLARQREETARALWGEAATWEVTGETGGWGLESPSGLYVRDTLTARIHPRRATEALAAAILARGGEVLREGDDRGAVVWTTGWQGLLELSEALGRTVGAGVKGQAAVLDADLRDRAQLFVEGLHVVPHADGTVAVGSTSEREFEAAGSVDGTLEDVVARARAAVPDLAGAAVLARWAGVRPRTRSRAPMLGPWPGRAGHFVANGGFKIGFGVAPLVGETLARLVLKGEDAIPDGFRVEDSLPRG
ncbi:NAD(P)/FAD-dependent oxidoreductase [Histidinibacterium aquaticum]|uniref:FAD-dependent oxidoreductase n=1 Tax=Histidinibacterium aquaticum TaxID=2613962 RepID=A0A5J5GCZ9_9RHOB|nr:FAD-dependent oxidoreductase [Histidinibacterium aquaticum]KAA9006069.1 FAD-dependent oxidoreductase [Histidinibacterium aquaticum]